MGVHKLSTTVIAITVLVTALSGCIDKEGEKLPSNEAPVADIIGPSTGRVHDVLAFDASNSTDDGGGVLEFAWEWGDGATGTGAVATHSYDEPGTYTINVTVTDMEGLEDTVSTEVIIKWMITVQMSSPSVSQFMRTETCWDAILNINKITPKDVKVEWEDVRLSAKSSSGAILEMGTVLAEDTGLYADPATLEYWFIDISGDPYMGAGDAIKITSMPDTWEGAIVDLTLDGELVATSKLPTDFP